MEETLVKKVGGNDSVDSTDGRNTVLNPSDLISEYIVTKSGEWNNYSDWSNFNKWNNWPNH